MVSSAVIGTSMRDSIVWVYIFVFMTLGSCFCFGGMLHRNDYSIYEFSCHEGIRVHLLWWFGAAVDVDENWDDTISNGKNNSLN